MRDLDINEVAKLSGLPASALRYYEEKGLVKVDDHREGILRITAAGIDEVESRLAEVFAALPKRGIPNLWVPDRRDCYPVDAMPVLGTGKLDLKKLSDLARELSAK